MEWNEVYIWDKLSTDAWTVPPLGKIYPHRCTCLCSFVSPASKGMQLKGFLTETNGMA